MSESRAASGRRFMRLSTRGWLVALAGVAVLGGTGWGTHGLWVPKSSPTGAHSSASPSPRPSPTPHWPLARLAASDQLDLGVARAYGAIDITGTPTSFDFISGWSLATTPTNLPTTLPVWRLRGFIRADVSALAEKLTLPVIGRPGVVGGTTMGEIDAARALVSGPSTLHADHTVMTDEEAVSTVSAVLFQLGIPALDGDPHVQRISDGAPSGSQMWQVQFVHRPVQGVPVGLRHNQLVAGATVDANGAVSNLEVHEMAVDGGSAYPLRPWREAWAEVTKGHWFDLCCGMSTGGDPVTPMRFRADKVELIDVQVDSSTTSYLVPFYLFTDTRDDLVVDVPALRLDDLAEPGGFQVTQPAR